MCPCRQLSIILFFTRLLVGARGTWCSGITSASHAEGAGFNPQCVHWSVAERATRGIGLPRRRKTADGCEKPARLPPRRKGERESREIQENESGAREAHPEPSARRQEAHEPNKTIAKPQQNHFTTIPKPQQNHSKTLAKP